jgi:hypothetical protein
MKCNLCLQRKAKRFCPAKNHSICPQCCGAKRILEIDCPESCEYLQTGRVYETREYVRHLRSAAPQKQEKHRRILDAHADVVAHMEKSLAKERVRTKQLSDKDVAEAVELLVDTYQTEDRGILYEKTSNNLGVDLLRKELRGIIESYRNPGKKKEEKILISAEDKRLPLKSAIECLEFIQDMVASHMQAQTSPTSYVDLLARTIPRNEYSDEERSSILIP